MKTKQAEPVVTDYNPEALIAYRMAAGLTQLGLAQAIGAKVNDVIRWETGSRGIPRRMILPLIRMLHCTETDLMSR